MISVPMQKSVLLLSLFVSSLHVFGQDPNRPLPSDHGMSGQDMLRESIGGSTTRLTKLQSPRIPDASFEAKGKIVKLDSFGVTIANKRGKTQLYLCCHKRVRFEAKKGTPLSRIKALSFSDFKVGDVVWVRFEGIHFIVQRLRLLERPS